MGETAAWLAPVALPVILLAAVALRVYRLNAGLWFDEILTYLNYARLPYSTIVTLYDSENQHFLYTLLAHTAFLLFGESGWALRLPAVLFGVGSIWALYLLAREVAGIREALLAAALMAFSYHHVWFSQNARGYTGLLFWALLSSWLLVRGLRESRSQLWIYYGITAALGIYTHMTMGFVVAGHFVVFLVALFVRRKELWIGRWNGLFLGFGWAGVLTLLLHAPVIPQILNTVGGTEVSVVEVWKSPLWTILEIIQGLRISFAGGIVPAAGAAAGLLLFGAGIVSYSRTRPIVLGLAFLPPLIGAAVVIAIGHHLWPRFFFFAMGFGVLIVIRGVLVLAGYMEMPLKAAGRKWQLFSKINTIYLGTALACGMILVSALSVPFVYGPKQDYEGARKFVETNLQPGDSVVVVNLAADAYEKFFRTGWERANTLQELNEIRSRSQRTWLLYTFPPVLASMQPEIMESIQSEFIPVGKFPGTVREGTVFVVKAEQ